MYVTIINISQPYLIFDLKYRTLGTVHENLEPSWMNNDLYDDDLRYRTENIIISKKGKQNAPSLYIENGMCQWGTIFIILVQFSCLFERQDYIHLFEVFACHDMDSKYHPQAESFLSSAKKSTVDRKWGYKKWKGR